MHQQALVLDDLKRISLPFDNTMKERERARGNRWRIGLVFYWLINGSTSDAYTFQVMKSGAIFEW